MVDDGSTDKSGEICDEYAEKDSRVKVLHKKNGGLSSARNAGIDIAQGNYLGFVDSDDYIEKDMYETLYSCIREYDAGMATCGICDLYNGVKKVWKKGSMERCVLDNVTAFKLVMESRIIEVYVVNKLYKKELFDNIRYPEGKTYEDTFTTPILMYNAKKVAYTPELKYYYVHRENSITTSKYKPSDICLMESNKKNLEFVKENVPELLPQAELRYLWAHTVFMDKLIKVDNPDKKLYDDILKEIRHNIFLILKNPFFTFQRKVGALILSISPSIYKKVLPFWEKKKYGKK